MDPITLKAAPGRRVVDPKTRRVIPEDGITVSRTDVFWRRRLRMGDVVGAPARDAAKPAPAANVNAGRKE